MAAMRGLSPTMWRWCCAAAALAACAGAARDFPDLVNVMYDICGAQKFDLTPESPCQFRLFGLSLAWQECGEAYDADMEGFRTCLHGCVSPRECDEVCEAKPANATQQCLAECGLVASCLQQSLAQATGQVSGESILRDCFAGRRTGASVAAPAAVALQMRGAAVARQVQIHPASAAHAEESRAAAEVDAAIAARRRVTPGAVATEGECSCDSSGAIRGVQTGQAGCKRHGREAHASGDWYCFINGTQDCPGAMASGEFPGLFWLGCAGPFQYFSQLFPAGCELLQFGFRTQEQPIEAPPMPKGHGTLQTDSSEPLQPRFENEVNASIARTLNPGSPLDAAWHAARGNVFLKPKTTAPDPGPPVPAALDEPLWWDMAQQTKGLVAEERSRAPKAKVPPKNMQNGPNWGFWSQLHKRGRL